MNVVYSTACYKAWKWSNTAASVGAFLRNVALSRSSQGLYGVILVTFPGHWRESEAAVQVIVRDNNVDQALKALKKKMQREGIFREMKLRRSYEKPSERRAREKAEAVRRSRKLERKRLEREGF